MPIKMTFEQSGKSKDIIHTSILLTIALCVGAYLISTTVIIAKDGVTFIEYAKNFTISPISTMLSQDQHPGYPFLIFTAHRIVNIAYWGSSLLGWIYSAQIVALIFRLLAVATLYFVGKEIVGPRFSFLAILILILLPKPAEYGSDALSDWPHIFFLSTGFLLLIRGATDRKWWLFGFAGLTAGLGYLIRPECAQLVALGSLWTVLQLFGAQRVISRRKAVFALALLLVGFLVSAGPYMRLKGTVFPKKQISRFTSAPQSCAVYEQQTQICSNTIYAAGFSSSDIAKGIGKLAENVGDTLMWFFVPALLIGAYRYFRGQSWSKPEKFFITALITLNIALTIWLYCKYGYISRRHTLPLVIFTIFYVPIGLQVFGNWVRIRFFKSWLETGQNPQLWFFILVTAGLAVCAPKLLTPIRTKKQSYRDAAQWLAKSTEEKDVIAVPDLRISFYSGRRGIKYSGQKVPEEAQYVVKVFKSEKDMPTDKEMLQAKKLFEGNSRKPKVIIYRQTH